LMGVPVHWPSTHLTRHFSADVPQPISASAALLLDRVNQTLPPLGGSAQPNTAHAHHQSQLCPEKKKLRILSRK